MHALVDKPFVMATPTPHGWQIAHDDASSMASPTTGASTPDAVEPATSCASGEIGKVRFVQTVQLGYERAGWFLRPELGGGGPYTGRATHMADIVPWLIGRTRHECAAGCAVRRRIAATTAASSSSGSQSSSAR